MVPKILGTRNVCQNAFEVAIKFGPTSPKNAPRISLGPDGPNKFGLHVPPINQQLNVQI